MFLLRKFGPDGELNRKANMISRVFSDEEGAIFYYIVDLIKNGKYAEAEYKKSLLRNMAEIEASEAKQAVYHVVHGYFCMEEGKPVEAINSFTQALSIEEVNPVAIILMAFCQKAIGNLEQEIILYDRALRMRKEHEYECIFFDPATISRYKAESLLDLKRYDEALETLNVYDFVYERDEEPWWSPALELRATLYALMEIWPSAREDYKRLFKRKPTYHLACSIAETYLLQVDLKGFDKFLSTHEVSLKKNEKGEVVYNRLLDFFLIIRKLHKSTRDYTRLAIEWVKQNNWEPITKGIDWNFTPLNSVTRAALDYHPLYRLLLSLERWFNGLDPEKGPEETRLHVLLKEFENQDEDT